MPAATARKLTFAKSRADAAPRQIEPSREPLLTARQAMEHLQLHSLQALYYHIEQNGLPTRRTGRAYRFDRRELDAWTEGRQALDEVLERTRVLRDR